MSATCKSCGAAIVWARTRSGKAMPLDAEPCRALGNVVLNADGTCEVVDKDDPPAGVELRTSHFATCPQAAGHRRKP